MKLIKKIVFYIGYALMVTLVVTFLGWDFF